MTAYTRESILEVLHQAGSQTVFYRWLVYTDRLTGEFERLAHQILGTRVWYTVYRRAGQSPASLSLADLQPCFAHLESRQETLSLKWADAPSPGSDWGEFVLGQEAYEAAVARLDDLITQVLLCETDQATFRKEHRF